jgi:GNAT superfamily N-acetyltransferase
MTVRPPQTPEEFEKYYRLRWKILRAPWNQPEGSEKDDFEKQSIHIIAFENDEVIGVGRVHFNSSSEAQLRYMAVDEQWQGKGIGKLILDELERRVVEQGANKIILHARDNAVKFYEMNGYEVHKPSHRLFGSIQHYLMEKKIERG